MRYALAMSLVSAVALGCGSTESQHTIPPDVDVSIIEEDVTPGGIKRSLDVRLSRKVTEAELTAIAHVLKNRDRRDYDRTFIVYYLAGMRVGAGGWATSHFEPTLKIHIQGLTIAQEQALAAPVVADANTEIIGSWLNERPFMGVRFTILRRDGKTYLETQYKDGSTGEREVAESTSPRGRIFREVTANSAGDHYVVTRAGTLEIRDDEGLIARARPIN